MRRIDISRRDIQAEFEKIGYRDTFRPHPLNKTITYIGIQTDGEVREWIKSTDPDFVIPENTEPHAAAFDLAASYRGRHLKETGQKIVG